MESSKEYINNKLQYLKERFSNITLIYKYKDCLDIHIVKVLPLDMFESVEFTLEESKIQDEFENTYSEEILFISSDSLTTI